MLWLKSFISFIICLIPSNLARCFLLNCVFGYKISNSKIGFMNIFFSNILEIKDSKIGNLNFFYLNKIILNENSIIGSKNILIGKNNFEKCILKMDKSQISFNNYFEFDAKLEIGKNVVFGGSDSKIYIRNKNISNTLFKENIFIGSNCCFQTGITINKNIKIGAGTIILKDIKTSGFYVSKKLNIIKVKNK